MFKIFKCCGREDIIVTADSETNSLTITSNFKMNKEDFINVTAEFNATIWGAIKWLDNQ